MQLQSQTDREREGRSVTCICMQQTKFHNNTALKKTVWIMDIKVWDQKIHFRECGTPFPLLRSNAGVKLDVSLGGGSGRCQAVLSDLGSSIALDLHMRVIQLQSLQ